MGAAERHPASGGPGRAPHAETCNPCCRPNTSGWRTCAGRLPPISTTPVQNGPTDDTPVAAAAPVPTGSTANRARHPHGSDGRAPGDANQAGGGKKRPPSRVCSLPPSLARMTLKPAAIAQLPAPAQPLAPPRPYYAPVMPAYSPRPRRGPRPQRADRQRQCPRRPFVGSALGMARSLLAAPVPVASAATLGYSAGPMNQPPDPHSDAPAALQRCARAPPAARPARGAHPACRERARHRARP